MPARMCLLLGITALLLGGAAVTPALSEEHLFTERLNRAQLEYRVAPRWTHHHVAWVRRWVWDDFWGDYHIVWVPRVTATRTVSYTPHSHRTHTATISDGSGDSAPTKSKDASGSKSDTSDKDNKNDQADKDNKTAAADSHTASSGPNTAKSDKDTTTAAIEPAARPQPSANPDKSAKLASLDAHPAPAHTAEKPAATVKADLTKPVTPAEIRTAVPLGKVADPKQTLARTPIKSVWGDAIGKVRGFDVSGGNLKTVNAELGGNNVVKIDPARLKYVKSRGLLITTMSKQDAEKLPKADNS
jgi:hypothetical protein